MLLHIWNIQNPKVHIGWLYSTNPISSSAARD